MGVITRASSLRSYLSGFTISNGTDATNDLNFAAGSCVDSTNSRIIVGSAIAGKQLDVAWAPGANAGGRMSAAAITNTTYHHYVILKDSDGTVDYGFDASATAPTMPSGYTFFRRVSAMPRVGGTILAFTQNGDFFRLTTPVLDINAGTQTAATPTTRIMGSLPTGIIVEGVFRFGQQTGASNIALYPLFASDGTPSQTASPGAQATAATGDLSNAEVRVFTDTSAQIGSNSNVTLTGTFYVISVGWFDRRGRDS